MSKFKIVCNNRECVLQEIDGKRKYRCSNELAQQLANSEDNIVDESEFTLEMPFAAKRWYGKSYADYVNELSKSEYNRRIIVNRKEYEQWVTPYAVPLEAQNVDWRKMYNDIMDIIKVHPEIDEATNRIITYLKVVYALRKL